jgi:hypothetical protein
MEMVEVVDERLRLNLHEGQTKAWDSKARYTAIIAGSQSGKTSFGPWWLQREIERRGPGDYLVVTPTFPLLDLKALPAFKELFIERLNLGRYVGSPTKKFVYSPAACEAIWGDPKAKVTVYFGHAQDPDSLESATAKAAWLDEAGQKKFKQDSFQAIQRRLRLHRGRVLITTTPYNLGWLKQQVYDRWRAGDSEYLVVNFESTMNPMFDEEEFEQAKSEMPRWKFDMFYRGIFTRPAGLIYDAYDEQKHLVEPFYIPSGWKHYLGLDFGGVNTAGIFIANEPGSPDYYAYREYLHGGRTAEQHVRYLRAQGLYWDSDLTLNAYGGAKSEQQWRDEFRAGGLYVKQPKIHEVEVGIDRVYGAFKTNRLYIFNTLSGLREELATYSRKLDDNGEPLEDIEDKNLYHHLDATRYVVADVIQRKRPKISSRKADTGPRIGYDVMTY